MTFKITKEWIDRNKTTAGGWTAAQLSSLGVSWPPKKRWQKKLIGKSITLEQKNLFETSATVSKRRKQRG